MKRRTLFLAALSLLLPSCALNKAEGLESYIAELPLFSGKDEVRVLQLTDLHWSIANIHGRQEAYVSALIDNADPDFIFITGDSVLGATRQVASRLIDLIDGKCIEKNIYWGTVLGNHEHQGLYGNDYWRQKVETAKRCITHFFDDDLYGDTNCVVNLNDEMGKTYFQLYGIDSNSLILNENMLTYDYDVIHDDQIEWYKKEAELAKTRNGGTYVPSIAYCHIVLWELEYAFRLAGLQGGTLEQGTGREGYPDAPGKIDAFSGKMKETYYLGVNTELSPTQCWVGYKHSPFFEVCEQTGVQGIFFGHDHANSFAAKYRSPSSSRNEDTSIAIGYGLKTGDCLSYEDGMMGGTLSVLKKDGTSTFYRAFQSYQDDYAAGAGYLEEAMFS